MFKDYWENNIKHGFKFEMQRINEHPSALYDYLPVSLKKVYGAVGFCKHGLLQLAHVDIMVGTKCSLKCEVCSQWNPYIKNRKMCSANEIISNIKKLTDYFDYIQRAAIIGGELFIMPKEDLIAIFSFINRKDIRSKFGKIVIITNSTIMPDKEVLKLVCRGKYEMWIDDYSRNANIMNSRMASDIRDLCRKMKIKTYYYPQKYWIDLGALDGKKIKDEEEIKCALNACFLKKCPTLYNGKLYRCVRTWVLENNDLEQPGRCEVIDLSRGKSYVDRLKEVYFWYGNDYIKACAWCNPVSKQKRIVAAKQIEK